MGQGENGAERAEALGWNIQSTRVPIDSYIDELENQGVPADMQWLLGELCTVVFDGRNSEVRHGVDEALGRPATDFSAYIRKTIESGTWASPSDQSS